MLTLTTVRMGREDGEDDEPGRGRGAGGDVQGLRREARREDPSNHEKWWVMHFQT